MIVQFFWQDKNPRIINWSDIFSLQDNSLRELKQLASRGSLSVTRNKFLEKDGYHAVAGVWVAKEVKHENALKVINVDVGHNSRWDTAFGWLIAASVSHVEDYRISFSGLNLCSCRILCFTAFICAIRRLNVSQSNSTTWPCSLLSVTALVSENRYEMDANEFKYHRRWDNVVCWQAYQASISWVVGIRYNF